MLPIAAVVAALDPEIAAKNMAEITVTSPKPPRARPTRACAKLISRPDIPDDSIRAPARMKNGMAANGKESIPANIRCTRLCSGMPEVCIDTIDVIPRAIAIGTPAESRRSNTKPIPIGGILVSF